MDNRAESRQPVPKRHGSQESDEHWLENMGLERGALAEDAEEPKDDDDEDDDTGDLEVDFASDEDEDFRS